MENKKIDVLVKRAQKGNNEALSLLYTYYFNQIYYYVYSRVNNSINAQEIVSDVFYSVVAGIKKYKGRSSFKNYLFGITKIKILDYIKNKYKSANYISQSSMDEEVYQNIPDYREQTSKENQTYRKKLRKVFAKILESMRPRYAKVLDLRFNQMHSIEQTAEIMGISANNVKVIQHRAIKQAKAIWEKMKLSYPHHLNLQF